MLSLAAILALSSEKESTKEKIVFKLNEQKKSLHTARVQLNTPLPTDLYRLNLVSSLCTMGKH